MQQEPGSGDRGDSGGLSEQDLTRIARLSQLAIEPDQLAAMAGDLRRVLELAQSMNGEDVAKLPPLLSPLEARSQTRGDEANLGGQIDRDQFFALQKSTKTGDPATNSQAAAHHDGVYFKVPKVLGESGGAA